MESKLEEGKGVSSQKNSDQGSKVKVVYKFCDIQDQMVDSWREQFKEYMPDMVQVYKGDIFKDGPAADAIVSPANSFGFMDGGIDMVFSLHFGWQMQERLQKKIREEYNGEILVGQSTIITTTEACNRNTVDWAKFNQGEPIKYLISAPTMRVPMDVSDTANAYLAFRGIILEVNKFNKTAKEPIRSVLCPGLGTAVGCMSGDRCAHQMLRAYETYEVGVDTAILHPKMLREPFAHFCDLSTFGSSGDKVRAPPKGQKVKKFTTKGGATVTKETEQVNEPTKTEPSDNKEEDLHEKKDANTEEHP